MLAIIRKQPDAMGGGLVPDSDLDKIIKLIPAEVVSVYVTALSFGPQVSAKAFPIVLFALGLVLVPTILFLDARKAGVPVEPLQYGLRTLAFVAWAFATSDPLGEEVNVDDWRWIPGLFVLVIPVLGSRLFTDPKPPT